MSVVRTEPPRVVLRRARLWILAAVLVLLVAGVSTLIGLGRSPGEARSPTNAAPAGSAALAASLTAHGIEVLIPSTLDEAATAAAVPGTTLLLDDPEERIGPEGHRRLDEAATRLVLLAPTQRALDDFGLAVAPDAFVPDDGSTVAADCPLGAVQRAGRIDGDAWTYRVRGEPELLRCWRGGDGAPRLLVGEDGRRAVLVLGTVGLLENQRILDAGNAAFALGVLGATPRLVWYQPTRAEGWAGEAEALTIGDVSPDWVIPVMVLLGLTVVAAGVWRGRRLGPLLAEPLPVVVPAEETVRGRARLYARANARLRALDALRTGAIGRLAAILGQPGTASVEAVAAGTAEATGRPPAAVLELLRDRVPRSDRELLGCAAALDELETELRERMRP